MMQVWHEAGQWYGAGQLVNAPCGTIASCVLSESINRTYIKTKKTKNFDMERVKFDIERDNFDMKRDNDMERDYIWHEAGQWHVVG